MTDDAIGQLQNFPSMLQPGTTQCFSDYRKLNKRSVRTGTFMNSSNLSVFIAGVWIRVNKESKIPGAHMCSWKYQLPDDAQVMWIEMFVKLWNNFYTSNHFVSHLYCLHQNCIIVSEPMYLTTICGTQYWHPSTLLQIFSSMKYVEGPPPAHGCVTTVDLHFYSKLTYRLLTYLQVDWIYFCLRFHFLSKPPRWKKTSNLKCIYDFGRQEKRLKITGILKC